MEFRLARIEDLKQLKIIYKEIIKNMNKNKKRLKLFNFNLFL